MTGTKMLLVGSQTTKPRSPRAGLMMSSHTSLTPMPPNPTNGTMKKMVTGSLLQCLIPSVTMLLVVVHGSGTLFAASHLYIMLIL